MSQITLETGFSSVQLVSSVQLFAALWTAAHQAPLSFTVFWSLLKLMSIESGCHPTILSSVIPSPAFSLSQHQSLFQWVSSSHLLAKVLELQLQHQSFQCIQVLVSNTIFHRNGLIPGQGQEIHNLNLEHLVTKSKAVLKAKQNHQRNKAPQLWGHKGA